MTRPSASWRSSQGDSRSARRSSSAAQQAQQQNSGGGGGGSSRQQQELIDETRKTARELERLSRERRDPQLAEMSRQLNEAANEMQRAQAAGQNKNTTEAIAQNMRALQKIEDAQRRMEQNNRAGNAGSVEDLKRRAENARAPTARYLREG